MFNNIDCIPNRVDRSRIEPKNNGYIYHDLEFSLSRDEIVKLLMTESLYKSPSLCIRELLQNSLDALRHRKCIFKKDIGIDWTDGKVKFKHELDEYGREVVSCEDNGIGMDEKIITNFLTKVGRSYYKSPEFLKDKETLASSGINFEPCSQFGIGFMSCFMLGDTIIIKTRRDYGYNAGKGIPLVVEINGLNGIIMIKRGDDNQEIGTSIKIVGRTKPLYLDKFRDKVKLVEVLNGYALACEFNIEAECLIDEIKDKTSIPNKIAIPKTFIEQCNINSEFYKTFEQDLSEIDKNLRGVIRTSLLVGEEGKFVLENEVAKWENINSARRNKFIVKKDINSITYDLTLDKTCCDGILVCGTPGRDKDISRILGSIGNVLYCGRDSFIVDIRGNLKPELTPARTPKGNSYDLNPGDSWTKIQDMMDRAQGMLWEKILCEFNCEDDPELFFKLISIYNVQLKNISNKILFNKLYIPFKDFQSNFKLLKLSEIKKLRLSENELKLYLNDEMFVCINENVKLYQELEYGNDIYRNIISLLIFKSSIDIEGNKVYINIENTDMCNCINDINGIKLLKYMGEADRYIVVRTQFESCNRDSDLVKYALVNKYNKDDLLANFISGLIYLLNNENYIINIRTENISSNMKRLGLLYNAIRWEEYNSKFKPPYSAWSQTSGRIDIEEADLKKWANAEPYDKIYFNGKLYN